MMQKVRTVVFFMVLMAVCLFSMERKASASEIKCGIYTKESSVEENNRNGTNKYYNQDSNVFFRDQLLYFELASVDSSPAIDYATLYINNTAMMTWNVQGTDYSWLSYHCAFTNGYGNQNYRWEGKWANSSETFSLSGGFVLEYVDSAAYTSDVEDGVSVLSGSMAPLSVEVMSNLSTKSSRTFQYQWYYADKADGEKILIPDAVTAEYQIKDTKDFTTRYYFCKVIDGYNEAFSKAIKVTSVTVSLEGKLKFDYSWGAVWLSEKDIEMEDGDSLESAVYQRKPRVTCTFSAFPKKRNSVDFDFYVSKDKNAPSEDWTKLKNAFSYIRLNEAKSSDWFSFDDKEWTYKKGETIYIKIVAKMKDYGLDKTFKKQIAIVSHQIPATLAKPELDAYRNGKKVYFAYFAEGTDCETQYRYKKTDSWKKIPKLCGKLKPMIKLNLKTGNDFYVRCRTSQKINGKKVYSAWSKATKISVKVKQKKRKQVK